MSSNERGHTSASHRVRCVADENRNRETFRPVALPALAAAVHAASGPSRIAQSRHHATSNLRLYVHEDDPVA